MTPGLPPLFRAKYPPAGYNQIPNQVLNHRPRYRLGSNPPTQQTVTNLPAMYV